MSGSSPIRLILADDHPIVLDGLRRLFESEADFQVVMSCVDGNAALDAVRAQPCDVIVLDLKMPGRTGLDVLQAMSDEKIPCRAVLLTAALKDEDVMRALGLGAMGVVLKESEPGALLECVRRVHRGEQWIDNETVTRALSRAMLREAVTAEVSKRLTPREMESCG